LLGVVLLRVPFLTVVVADNQKSLLMSWLRAKLHIRLVLLRLKESL
jgi:hypothetical protein